MKFLSCTLLNQNEVNITRSFENTCTYILYSTMSCNFFLGRLAGFSSGYGTGIRCSLFLGTAKGVPQK